MKEKIQQLMDMYAVLNPLLQKSSDLINQAKEGSRDRKILIHRNGDHFKITEYALWQEIWENAETNAREILAEKYPECFETAREANKLKSDIIAFCQAELGINPEQMEFGRLVQFIISLIDWRLEVHANSENNKDTTVSK